MATHLYSDYSAYLRAMQRWRLTPEFRRGPRPQYLGGQKSRSIWDAIGAVPDDVREGLDRLPEVFDEFGAHFGEIAKRRAFRGFAGAAGLGVGIVTGNPALATAGGGYLYSALTGGPPPAELEGVFADLATDGVDWSDITTPAQQAALREAAERYPDLAVGVGNLLLEASEQIIKLKAQAAGAIAAAKKSRRQAEQAIEAARIYKERAESRWF